MLASLALMILVGLSLASIVEKLKLPRIIGLLVTGIVLGPYVLNVLDDNILNISSQLRQIALIIILIKAGLTLNLKDLKKVGRPAILMAFLPATFELIAYIIFAPMILGVTRLEAALMGAVLAAVSPAVVVPRMVYLIENKYGTKKAIPQMILAGASCDDIYVIVLFSTFVTMVQGGHVSVMNFINIPVSIILGIGLGMIAGLALAWLFKHQKIQNSMKIIIIMGLAFLLMSVETWLEDYVSLSGLLAVVSLSCVIKITSSLSTSSSLADMMGKLWLFAEIMLFVLVGAAVDIRYAFATGIAAIIMIFIALIVRAVGVWICLIGTNLTIKERMFCVIAYLPKATVQAAIGSVPLSLGLSCGSMILSVAVLAILITAPLGAIGIDKTYQKFLVKEII
ncbi:MAG: cation:proton antiporter [Erysipelotrichaceae bacterium]|nr:cation:proton antiporter [Erysipelotrichaceae bacterium]